MADNFLALLEKEKPEILAHLPEWITPDRWWAMAYEMARNPDLQKATPLSLLNAFKRIADWGLELDGEEAFINVYGNEAVAQSMYKGLIRRAVEAGVIAHAVADVIKEGDSLEIISGTAGRQIVHKPAFGLKGGKRPIIGAYALFTLPNGMVDYELCELSDIESFKNAALRMARRSNPKAELSPAWRFQEGEQCKKSVLRRGLKRFRGKRDTNASHRFNEMMDSMRHVEPLPGDEPPPDDLPPPKSVVAEVVTNLDTGGKVAEKAPMGALRKDTPSSVQVGTITIVVPDVDGAGRAEGSHVGSESASKEAGSSPLSRASAAPRSGGADDPTIGPEEQQAIIDGYRSRFPKEWLGRLSQSLYDFGQLGDVSELKMSQLSAFLSHSEKFA